jgi:ribose transport system substrate-binding protein
VVDLKCDFPTCNRVSEAIHEAGAALGWNVKSIVYKTGSPQPAVTSALNSPGVEYITLSGIPRSIIEPQIKEAEEKGIVFIATHNPEPPELPTWPVSIGEKDSVYQSEGITEWIIKDSGGKANIAMIGYPEVPITAAAPPAVEALIGQKCSECSFVEVPVTGEEVASGGVPAKVVAFLQSHPEVNYLVPAFNNLLLGVPEALTTAGLAEQVKVTGVASMEEAEASMVEKGEVVAYNIVGQAEDGAMSIDAIARISENLPLPQSIYESSQYWLCTPATFEECKGWEAPTNYLQEWEELWGVK